MPCTAYQDIDSAPPSETKSDNKVEFKVKPDDKPKRAYILNVIGLGNMKRNKGQGKPQCKPAGTVQQ